MLGTDRSCQDAKWDCQCSVPICHFDLSVPCYLPVPSCQVLQDWVTLVAGAGCRPAGCRRAVTISFGKLAFANLLFRF